MWFNIMSLFLFWINNWFEPFLFQNIRLIQCLHIFRKLANTSNEALAIFFIEIWNIWNLGGFRSGRGGGKTIRALSQKRNYHQSSFYLWLNININFNLWLPFLSLSLFYPQTILLFCPVRPFLTLTTMSHLRILVMGQTLLAADLKIKRSKDL